eukprot:6183407-Pleurochrysis_carterae.AAC.1
MWFGKTTVRAPGKLGFDPLGLMPKDKEGAAKMELSELKNGRMPFAPQCYDCDASAPIVFDFSTSVIAPCPHASRWLALPMNVIPAENPPAQCSCSAALARAGHDRRRWHRLQPLHPWLRARLPIPLGLRSIVLIIARSCRAAVCSVPWHSIVFCAFMAVSRARHRDMIRYDTAAHTCSVIEWVTCNLEVASLHLHSELAAPPTAFRL